MVRGLGIALTVLVCTGAGSLLALALLARTDGAGISRVAGHPVLTVLSDSMTPTFRSGDLLLDRPTGSSATDLAVGDVITFRAAGSDALITHRIVAVQPDPAGIVAYRTQGDANNAPDPEPVSPGQVVGTYSAHVPYAGYALRAAHSRQGIFLLIVIPAMALLLPEFRSLWRATAASAAGRSAQTNQTATTGMRPGRRADPTQS